MSKTTICILIMCTNEEHIIGESLKSTLPYATDYIICDNASTDNTVQVCQDFFKDNNIKGQIFHYQWKDFGHNYSYLYELAYNHTTSEYWWQIDADDLVNGQLDVSHLTKDKYFLYFGDDGNIRYTRPQIFKNRIKYQHVLKIHGYITTKPKNVYHTSDTIEGDYYIASRRLGNRHKTDFKTKYLNDAKMLQEDINNPLIDYDDKTRCYFYLGQSYMCAGEYKKSIRAYRKRIKRGGWDEEIFVSKYQIGKCYKYLSCSLYDTTTNNKYYKHALFYFKNCYQFRPTRTEGLYEAAKFCREIGLYEDAYKYIKMGIDISIPNDTLFVMTTGYLWGFDFELSIVCYYLNKYDEGREACERLLNNKNLPDDVKLQVIKNSQFYK